ncbi:unnamed protein product [Pleuronectes platessa]|uniref:Uncharacterized protein n=1 Tax=Pleuronectes platessa TaxID=8262 RepID=A0A9N7TZB7_PLEPL|nr:unnamed protein product [Pleuronectes platessa]
MPLPETGKLLIYKKGEEEAWKCVQGSGSQRGEARTLTELSNISTVHRAPREHQGIVVFVALGSCCIHWERQHRDPVPVDPHRHPRFTCQSAETPLAPARHHLPRGSFRRGQNEQLAALLTL